MENVRGIVYDSGSETSIYGMSIMWENVYVCVYVCIYTLKIIGRIYTKTLTTVVLNEYCAFIYFLKFL